MKGLLIRWLIVTLAILLSAYLIDGIIVTGFFAAFLAAAVLGILNAFLRPILLILTLPVNIVTFGLFTFVINAFLLKLASGVIPGFEIRGFWAAVLGALIISIISWLLNSFVGGQGKVGRSDVIDLQRRGGGRWE